jgi:hypothetical protein
MRTSSNEILTLRARRRASFQGTPIYSSESLPSISGNYLPNQETAAAQQLLNRDDRVSASRALRVIE